MKKTNYYVYCARLLTVVAAGLIALPVLAKAPPNPGYRTNNIVSNVRGQAPRFDRRVVNPWGVAFNATHIFVAENGAGLINILNRDGAVQRSAINVPAPAGSTNLSTPTGILLNNDNTFFINNGTSNGVRRRSLVLFATQDGAIGGWNPAIAATNAFIAVNNSSNAVYTSLAMADTTNGTVLYAANFKAGVIEAYNTNFAFIGSFTDTNPPAAGYAPYGMKIIQKKLFVAFSKQLAPANSDAEAGPGNGFVDIFNLDGELVRRFAQGEPLNAPWGLALAPMHFGKFSGTLLVGNFGDGVINSFNVLTGEFLGSLTTADGNTIAFPGLWSLDFGREPAEGRFDFDSTGLFFTAGINGETNGLIGSIRAINPFLAPVR